MILFVDDNSGVLFIKTVLVRFADFVKITSLQVIEYMRQTITTRDSV